MIYKSTAILSITGVFLLLCGCAGTPIRPGDLSRLKNQAEIPVVNYRSTAGSFRVMTPGTMGRGILFSGPPMGTGATVMGIEAEMRGKKMIADYHLPDFSRIVRERFLFTIAEKLGLNNMHLVQEPLMSDDELKRFGKGLVMDFRQEGAGLMFYFSDRDHYYISNNTQVRLIDIEDEGFNVIWQGICRISGNDPKASPIMDKLTADNAALLRTKLYEAADDCVKQLTDQFIAKEKM